MPVSTIVKHVSTPAPKIDPENKLTMAWRIPSLAEKMTGEVWSRAQVTCRIVGLVLTQGLNISLYDILIGSRSQFCNVPPIPFGHPAESIMFPMFTDVVPLAVNIVLRWENNHHSRQAIGGYLILEAAHLEPRPRLISVRELAKGLMEAKSNTAPPSPKPMVNSGARCLICGDTYVDFPGQACGPCKGREGLND